MDKLNNPHDKYFRASMSDPRVAKSFLQAHLPEKILSEINFDSLHVESGHHVDQRLSETITDMLYRVQFGKGEGYVCILVEHQSTVDPLMPFRILSYVIDIMHGYVEQNPRADLPLVIPLVFYSGKAPYTGSTDIFTLFGDLEPLAREIFLKPFHLIDLTQIPDETLRQHTWAAVMELVQKHIWAKNFLSALKVLAPLLRDLAERNGEDYIYKTLRYICNTAQLDDPAAFVRIIEHEISPKVGEEAKMTLAQIWEEQGRQKGLEEAKVTLAKIWEEQGRQKGLEEAKVTLAKIWEEQGRQKGELMTKRQIAERLLEQGANIEFVSKVTGLTPEELSLPIDGRP